MKRFLILFIFFLFQLSIGQENNLVEININASVLDYDSKKGIPFSEVKYIEKNVGVLTNQKGGFSLNYLDQNINEDDVFMITAYGYDTIKTTADKLSMKGEPVNIATIEKKIREEFEEVSSKIKDIDYEEVKTSLKKKSTTFFNFLENVLD